MQWMFPSGTVQLQVIDIMHEGLCMRGVARWDFLHDVSF